MGANSWGRVVGRSVGAFSLLPPGKGRVESKAPCLCIVAPFLIFQLFFWVFFPFCFKQISLVGEEGGGKKRFLRRVARKDLPLLSL